MKFRLPSSLFALLLAVATNSNGACEARRSNGGGRAPASRSSRSSGGRASGNKRTAPTSKQSRRTILDDYDDDEPEEDDFDFRFPGDEEEDDDTNNGDGYDYEEDVDEYDDYADDMPSRQGSRQAPQRGSSSREGSGKRGSSRSSGNVSRGSRGSSSSRGSGRSSREGSRGGRKPSSGRVVPYGNRRAPQPGAFARGIAALRDSIPDAGAIKDSAFNSITAAKESTSKLTSNVYREIKGLTSSELEQVMLKATQPNDLPVKGSHVERLVGVTYQISGRYDIYDAVLRKLWSKMVEKDWRTSIKALYILHRFSADGAPSHRAALKARLRELRRTRDPKRKEKYFNSKQLLAGDATPDTEAFRAFLGRYAHYVLLRAQCFGGMFAEIAENTNTDKRKPDRQRSKQQQPSKCITSTCLKNEHLEASQMLLKAGLLCELKEEEECENTAIALERVVSDLIGLTTAIAKSLNTALEEDDGDDELDRALLKKWCEFYSEELLPKTKSMMKRTSPPLDAYGLYLPSRMGASVPQDLLQKGLKGLDNRSEDELPQETESPSPSEDANQTVDEEEEEKVQQEEIIEEEAEEDNDYDEYEYDEYEYDEY